MLTHVSIASTITICYYYFVVIHCLPPHFPFQELLGLSLARLYVERELEGRHAAS